MCKDILVMSNLSTEELAGAVVSATLVLLLRVAMDRCHAIRHDFDRLDYSCCSPGRFPLGFGRLLLVIYTPSPTKLFSAGLSRRCRAITNCSAAAEEPRYDQGSEVSGYTKVNL